MTKSIIHAQNVYELIRPDRFGIELLDFCEILEQTFRERYSAEEFIGLSNRRAKKHLHGVKLDLKFRFDGSIQSRSQNFTEERFLRDNQIELAVVILDDASGLPGTEKVREAISVPLWRCFAKAPDLFGTYTVYAHTYTTQNGFFGIRKETEPSYVGVTRRSWPSRWNEHLAAARCGSPYRFHEGIRRFYEKNPVYHEVLCCGLSRSEAMKAEEAAIDKWSLYPKGFNMIPGGEAGIKYLAEKGFPQTNKSWEQREKSIRALTDDCARKGIPNPLISALWRDDDYAASIICSNPNNFNLEKVRQIRFMKEIGKTPEEIAEQFGCSLDRIKRLVGGDTYSRVA